MTAARPAPPRRSARRCRHGWMTMEWIDDPHFAAGGYWSLRCDQCAIGNYRRAAEINRAQINSWLWICRHALRQRNPRRALEALHSALWLLGIQPNGGTS